MEVLVAEHHALVSNLAYETFGSDVVGPIGEIGYRAYSGTSLDGFFIGPSLVGGVLSYRSDCYSSPPCGRGIAYMTSIALDAGYQRVFGNQVVLGVGGGVAYQHADHHVDFSAENPGIIFFGTGFLPRFLFSVGYAF